MVVLWVVVSGVVLAKRGDRDDRMIVSVLIVVAVWRGCVLSRSGMSSELHRLVVGGVVLAKFDDCDDRGCHDCCRYDVLCRRGVAAVVC